MDPVLGHVMWTQCRPGQRRPRDGSRAQHYRSSELRTSVPSPEAAMAIKLEVRRPALKGTGESELLRGPLLLTPCKAPLSLRPFECVRWMGEGVDMIPFSAGGGEGEASILIVRTGLSTCTTRWRDGVRVVRVKLPGVVALASARAQGRANNSRVPATNGRVAGRACEF